MGALERVMTSTNAILRGFFAVALLASATLALPPTPDQVVPETRLAQAGEPVYKTTNVIFGDASIKDYMYKNICPIAAGHMLECYRCNDQTYGDHGRCIEYQKFASEDDFNTYTQYKWLAQKHKSAFLNSDSKTTKYEDLDEDSYNAAVTSTTMECEKVDPTMWMTTTVNLGDGPVPAPFHKFKDYMYTNICPLAAAEMDECYRCPSADGKQCVEYQKFTDVHEFTKYTQYTWLPSEGYEAFVNSGSTVTEYQGMLKDEFEAAITGSGCEVVTTAAPAHPAPAPAPAPAADPAPAPADPAPAPAPASTEAEIDPPAAQTDIATQTVTAAPPAPSQLTEMAAWFSGNQDHEVKTTNKRGERLGVDLFF